MSRVLVYEPKPWFLPELLRQYAGSGVVVGAGRERRVKTALTVPAQGPEADADGAVRCVVVDVRSRPERGLALVEELRRRHPDGEQILIADERLGPLEWVLRELGVTQIEMSPVRGVDLKPMIDRVLGR